MAKETITSGAGVLWSAIITSLNNMFTEVYQVFTGKSGGQTITGGTAASEALTLSSTAHATKGTIEAGPLSISEVAGTVSIGPTTIDRATVNIDTADSTTYAWEVRKGGVLYSHQVISDAVKGMGLLNGTYLAFQQTEGAPYPLMRHRVATDTGISYITTEAASASGAPLHISPDGLLRIFPKNQADKVELNWTGGTFINSNALSVLDIKKADNAAISILTPNTKGGWLMFGDPEDSYIGGITYDHLTDKLSLMSNNVIAFTLDSAQKCTLSKGLSLSPLATETPAVNGQMKFEATNNTTLTIKFKGSDGTVRSVALTLA